MHSIKPLFQKSFLICWVFLCWLGGYTELNGQTAAVDSVNLISILNNCCASCSLNDPTSPDYWDTSRPVSTWSGVGVRNGRVSWLFVEGKGLSGTLPSLNNCTELEALLCRDNDLTMIGSLDSCRELREIWCNGNNLAGGGLPSFDQLEKLEILECDSNQLVSLPSLDHCTSLRLLNCAHNKITQLPSLDSCTALEELICGYNPMLELPSLANCSNLEILNCRFMDEPRLQQLGSLDNCRNLRSLDCYVNSLTSVPSLDNCTKLVHLNCNNNMLESLPSLANCPDLESLEFQWNGLTEVPDIGNCSKLTRINMLGNLQIGDIPFPSNHDLVSEIYFSYGSITFHELEAWAMLPLIDSGAIFCDNNPAIHLVQKDSIPALENGTYALNASAAGGPNTRFEWYYNPSRPPVVVHEATRAVTILGTVFPADPSNPNLIGDESGWYGAKVTNINVPGITLYTQSVYIEFDQGVKCGDSNLDGEINMLDLAMVGLNYGKTGYARQDSLPTDTTPQACLRWTLSPGYTEDQLLHGELINLKHGDCNGDGIINEDDVECISNYYQRPYAPPEFLQNELDPQMKLTASPRVDRIEAYVEGGDTLIRVPYSIDLTSLPEGYDSLKVRGIIFTRPVSESPYYGVDTIWAEFDDSDFIPDSSRALWLQKYHPDIPVSAKDATSSCYLDTSYTHPLDVGVFNKDSAVYLRASQNCINCIVVLEEPCSPSNYDNGVIRNLPLMLSTANVIIYAEDSAGNPIQFATECTQDTTFINVLDLLSEWPDYEGKPCSEGAATAFPNPIPNDQTLMGCVHLYRDSAYNLKLVSITGREIFEQNQIPGKQGFNQFEVDLQGLDPGLYLLMVQSEQLKDRTQWLRIQVLP